MATHTRELHRVTPPDFEREKTERYYAYGADLFEHHFGRRPSRNTLYKYATGGFPVRKGGPYVEVPVVDRLKRLVTTRQAMRRFIQQVRKLEKAQAAPRRRRPKRQAKATA